MSALNTAARQANDSPNQGYFPTCRALELSLVETAFISNPDEEAKLKSDKYQEQLADALMRGISRYFAKNPPLARSRQT